MEEKRSHQNSARTTQNKLSQPALTQPMQAMAPPPFQLMAQPAPVAQKMERDEEEGEALQMKVKSAETVQKMATDEEDEGPFQMKTIQLQDKGGEAKGGNGQTPKPNNTGLPDNLKAGIENLSGYSMDDVKVHYNSDKPAQLQAHAYAQGTDIHIGPGQEKHLPHEAWHVVQQKQGRVKPTVQMKGGEQVNDDAGLEKEADVMGEKALQGGDSSLIRKPEKDAINQRITVQRHSLKGNLHPSKKEIKGFTRWDIYTKETDNSFRTKHLWDKTNLNDCSPENIIGERKRASVGGNKNTVMTDKTYDEAILSEVKKLPEATVKDLYSATKSTSKELRAKIPGCQQKTAKFMGWGGLGEPTYQYLPNEDKKVFATLSVNLKKVGKNTRGHVEIRGYHLEKWT